jgi:hypothetical protein
MTKIFLIFISMIITGCASHVTTTTTESQPNNTAGLTIQSFFTGTVTATGVVINRDKKSTRQFTRTIKGKWNGDNGVMQETVRYTDGVTAERGWCIHLIDAHHFAGVSTDVDGVIQGSQDGDEIQMLYRPSQDIYASDNLHTAGESIELFRRSPLENIFSLLTSGSLYSTTKAITTINRENIKPLRNHVTYSYDDAGPFCNKVREIWHQHNQTMKTTLTNKVWIYAIDKNNALEKISIFKKNLEVGEVIQSLYKK